MVSFIVVSGHKFFQSPLQFFGSEVIIEFHDVFHGSVIAFNLSLCLRMIRPAVYLLHLIIVFQIGFQFRSDIARTVIRQQSRIWLGNQSGFYNSPVYGSFDILGFHGRTKFPVHDITAVIIQNGTQILPTPAQDFKAGKISLLYLMYKACFVGKFIGCTQENVGWCRNESS